MATAAKQLEDIFQELSQRFSGDGRISITPIYGDPPEKYTVTYRVTGIHKDESGGIHQADEHIITISIPFGFPHFPPSCKPKSPIFHPDFDPAAICIGDFWEKDRMISDLILHIGDMISGRIFSSENAFNEEAAAWYKENGSRLPFDSEDSTEIDLADPLDLTQLDEGDMTAGSDGDGTSGGLEEPAIASGADFGDWISTAGPGDEMGNDTLDESFLETDAAPPFSGREALAIEESDSTGDDDGEVEEQTAEVDTDRLRLLVRQKRFFELDAALGAISGVTVIPEQQSLQRRAADELDRARKLYDQAMEFERQGNSGKALDCFHQVEAIVVDYPGLPEDIERVGQAAELLGDWEASAIRAADKQGDLHNAAEKPAGSAGRDRPGDGGRKKSDYRTFFEETAQHTSKLLPFAAAGILVVIMAAGAVLYFLNSSRLAAAGEQFDVCRTSLQQKRFAEAERQCEVARDLSERVRFFKSGARNALQQEIDATLGSEVMREGLAGNILYEGKYLPEEAVENMIAFKQFSSEGDRLLADEEWQQAASAFSQALQIASREERIDPTARFKIGENLKYAEFRGYMRSGSEFISREQWVLASQDLEHALKLAEELPLETKAETVAAITSHLDEIAVLTSKERGDVAFSEQRWNEALQHYRHALETAEQSENAGSEKPLIETLRRQMLRAELYSTIDIGKNAFRNAQWDTAIKQYEQAIALLESNGDLLRQANTEENRKKLAHVMLQASISKDRQAAAEALKEERYQEAITYFRSISKTVGTSEFAGDPEFAALVKETGRAIEQAKADLLLAGKRDYLRDNFTELFTRHYSASPPESLTEQKVFFDKRVDDDLIFRLECVEVGQGRPLRLVMKYAYHLQTGTWSFYSGSE